MVLYKYGGPKSFRIIEDLRLKITPPNQFNDPFEVTPRSKSARDLAEMLEDVQKNPNHYREMCEEMVHKGAFAGSVNECVNGLPEAIKNHHREYRKLSTAEMIKRDLATADDFSRGFGVLCFAKFRDDIPMWSYYADHHQGIAIGIESDKLGNFPGFADFVHYRKLRAYVNPYLGFSDVGKRQRLATLFTKSLKWKHENEYRRVFRLNDICSVLKKHGSKFYFIDIDSEAIKEIIFGCRIKKSFEGKIKRLICSRPRTFGHIRLYRAVRHPRRFQLEIVPLEKA